MVSVWDDIENEAPSDKCPEPGIYPGISFAEYCAWDAINHSKLCKIDKSPLHAVTLSDLEKSPAIRLGQLVHAGKLEPGSVQQRYAVMPQFELDSANTTKDGKPSVNAGTEYVKTKRAEFMKAAIAERKTVISQAEFDQYQSALDAINANSEVVSMINEGECELSIVWHDKHTGLRCKARIDCKCVNRIMDLKTSRDDGNGPLPVSFEYSLWTYSYYSQAAFYQTGWETLTGERLPFWFAVVSTDAPRQCIAAPVGEMTLQLGRDKNTQRMATYAACKKANRFPGYDSPELFELPEKYFPELELEGFND